MSADKPMDDMQNSSRNLTPMSRLPSELLLRIFEMVDDSDPKILRSDFRSQYPGILIQVCPYWRRLILNDPCFWTQLHFVSSKVHGSRLYDRAELYLKYASESRLDLYFHGGRRRSLGSQFDRILGLVAQVAPRINSLSWRTDRIYSSPHEILANFIRNSTSNTISSLNLRSYVTSSSYVSRLNDVRLSIRDSRSGLSLDQIEEFLAPLDSLSLCLVYIGWSSSAYHSLSHLDLAFDPLFAYFPTIMQFEAILLASPRLRSLKLYKFGLLSAPVFGNAATPVTLKYLETLFLKEIRRRSIKPLLSLIRTGNSPLYMHFDVPTINGDFQPYVKFLRCSRVVKLVIHGPGYFPLYSLLASLTNTQSLMLINFVLNARFFKMISQDTMYYATEKGPAAWSQLRAVHLVQCFFDSCDDYSTLPEPPLSKLLLWIWQIRPQWFYCTTEEFNNSKTQGFMEAVRSSVPNLQDPINSDINILLQTWKLALDFARLRL